MERNHFIDAIVLMLALFNPLLMSAYVIVGTIAIEMILKGVDL